MTDPMIDLRLPDNSVISVDGRSIESYRKIPYSTPNRVEVVVCKDGVERTHVTSTELDYIERRVREVKNTDTTNEIRDLQELLQGLKVIAENQARTEAALLEMHGSVRVLTETLQKLNANVSALCQRSPLRT